MKVEFADDGLSRKLTDDAHRLGLPFAVIKIARRRLIQLEAATDERDLRNLSGLDYKKRKADPHDTRSIRVNDQYRIFFVLSGSGSATTATVTLIGDPH